MFKLAAVAVSGLCILIVAGLKVVRVMERDGYFAESPPRWEHDEDLD